jgi:hypothetical protein
MPIKISQLPTLNAISANANNALLVVVDLEETNEYLKTKKITVEDFLISTRDVGTTPNLYYVTPGGDDSRDGKSWDRAFLTIERAIEVVANVGGRNLIEVGPGTYETEGHIDVPDDTIIKSAHRTAVMRPKAGFEERNVFRLGSGCFLEGFLFEDFRLDDMDNPTEGFAVSFRPGAVIRRVPYAHKIAVRTTPSWTFIAPPLDRANSNPLVGIGAGVVIADGSVCSPYSIFPNIMTWGATPVSHNGIGYCAKNGGLINAVNAVSLWAHKHFLAIDGGQIILSSCSTQFGDYTMVSKGVRQIINPVEANTTLTIQSASANAIYAGANTIINNTWIALSTTINSNTGNVYTAGWNAEDEVYTKRDTGTLLQSIAWALQAANEKPMTDFAKGLFDTKGVKVYTLDKEDAFLYSFDYIRDQIIALPNVTTPAANIVTSLISALKSTINTPTYSIQPSTITAIGHTWSSVMSGVALTKIPPVVNQAKISDSILELEQGLVIASGQDDQGSALFVGGMIIDSDTGELSGPPFESAVNRIATKTVISRSF